MNFYNILRTTGLLNWLNYGAGDTHIKQSDSHLAFHADVLRGTSHVKNVCVGG